MTLVAVPETSVPVARKSRRWLYIALASVAAVALAVWAWTGSGRASATVAQGAFHIVTVMNPFEVKLTKDGELQAVHNIDIISQVEGNNTIQQIVREGATVKRGDVLVMLDSSAIKQRIEDITLSVQKAEADVTYSREMKEIQESQNATNLDTAETSLMLAKLDLQQYLEGSYPQQLANARTELEMAKLTLKNREEDLAQTRSLYLKGFVTAADVKKGELDVITARNAVAKADTALNVLEKYTHRMDEADKRNKLAQAEQRLVRTKRENSSNMSQRIAELRARAQALDIEQRRLARFKEQYENCTIEAPADGMVVYASTVDRNMRDPIQEGTQVRERQLLLRLPDTSDMKAIVRIQESMVPRLAEGQRARVRIVGVSEPVTATLSKISVLADSSQRWWNPDLKEYPVELILDQTPPGLKPGVGAAVEIFINSLNDATAVPLAAIYAAGSERYVFVRTDDGLRPRRVKLGETTETHAQVLDGVKPSEQVLMLQAGQGRELLEKAGIKVTPATRPSVGPRRNPPPDTSSGTGIAAPNANPRSPDAPPAERPRGRRSRQ